MTIVTHYFGRNSGTLGIYILCNVIYIYIYSLIIIFMQNSVNMQLLLKGYRWNLTNETPPGTQNQYPSQKYES